MKFSDFNPSELHDAWLSAIFAATGALLVNVMTSMRFDSSVVIQAILLIVAFIMFTKIIRLKSGALKELELDYKESFNEIKTKSILLFIVGLICMITVVIMIFVGNEMRYNEYVDTRNKINLLIEDNKIIKKILIRRDSMFLDQEDGVSKKKKRL
jgi:hypothetical protein